MKIPPVRDLYDVLGVERAASADEITEAYSRLIRLYRDDLGARGEWAESRVREIEAAYATLSDPGKRAEYDASNNQPSPSTADLIPGAVRPPPTDSPASQPAAASQSAPAETSEPLSSGEPSPTSAPGRSPSFETPRWEPPTPPPPWPGEGRAADDAVLTGPVLSERAAAEHPGPRPQEEPHRKSWNPVDRLTAGLPRAWRIAIDWIVTIAGAIAIVLAIKAWVVNPYRIPSSSMEPTLHCARPGRGCEARLSDRVLANRFIYHFRSPHRKEIVVFKTPPQAEARCGAGGTFVKRVIGLPGDKVTERDGFVFINGKKLDEPYIKPERRDHEPERTWNIGQSQYFMMGDNRAASCDSRVWGSVPRKNLIGPVFSTYWPPNRISFR